LIHVDGGYRGAVCADVVVVV